MRGMRVGGASLSLALCLTGSFWVTNGKETPHGDDCDDDVFIVL